MKTKRLIAATCTVFILSASMACASNGAPKFPILHKTGSGYNSIEVSCNSGGGHWEHGDFVERISILISGFFNC
jgi:hypothetical protein